MLITHTHTHIRKLKCALTRVSILDETAQVGSLYLQSQQMLAAVIFE